MKKAWQYLTIAAAAAAVASLIPYRIRKDPDTGDKTVDALLWKYTSRLGEEGEMQKELTLFPPRVFRKPEEEEESLWLDQPEDEGSEDCIPF